jgi:hypothetical protein
MNADDWTFGLAMIGYGLLATDFVMLHLENSRRWLSYAAATVIVVHVLLVWGHRFDWSFDRMIAKSILGFFIFHTALLLVICSAILPSNRRLWVTTTAFALVTAGALPAPFRYPELSILMLPMIGISTSAVGLVCVSRFKRK